MSNTGSGTVDLKLEVVDLTGGARLLVDEADVDHASAILADRSPPAE